MGGRYTRWSVWLVGVSLLGGCVTQNDAIEVRAVESASSRIKGGSGAFAEARGLLGLGNPGLALEAFRKIQREQPSADALAGIAACYVAMGRDDLAKTNLEAALALHPQSADLLRSVALVMDRLGLKSEAADARVQAEAIAAGAKESVAAAAPFAVQPPAPSPELGIVADEVAVVQPEARLLTTGLAERAIAEITKEVQRLVSPPAPVTSITVKLPPLQDSAPVATARPRIERLSPKEVALVTDAKPYWTRPVPKRKSASVDDPRWRPVRSSAAAPNLRLLNAARVEGLASAARTGLAQRGWRRIEVGDHTAVRARSLVLYPAGKQRIGMSLARHFGIAAAQTRGQTVTILLGRDVASRLDS